MNQVRMIKAHLNTPLGTAEICGDQCGIKSIKILEDHLEDSPVPAELIPAVEQLKAYFAGELKEFNLKIHPEGTPFQKKVWHSLSNISFGKTISYFDLSNEIGNIKAIRAVAAANGKNPLWIVVPCHRVIGRDGSLTGYAGGLWRKKWLLDHENPVQQQSLF